MSGGGAEVESEEDKSAPRALEVSSREAVVSAEDVGAASRRPSYGRCPHTARLAGDGDARECRRL